MQQQESLPPSPPTPMQGLATMPLKRWRTPELWRDLKNITQVQAKANLLLSILFQSTMTTMTKPQSQKLRWLATSSQHLFLGSVLMLFAMCLWCRSLSKATCYSKTIRRDRSTTRILVHLWTLQKDALLFVVYSRTGEIPARVKLSRTRTQWLHLLCQDLLTKLKTRSPLPPWIDCLRTTTVKLKWPAMFKNKSLQNQSNMNSPRRLK